MAPGNYLIAIKYGGPQHIVGSPFKAKITGLLHSHSPIWSVDVSCLGYEANVPLKNVLKSGKCYVIIAHAAQCTSYIKTFSPALHRCMPAATWYIQTPFLKWFNIILWYDIFSHWSSGITLLPHTSFVEGNSLDEQQHVYCIMSGRKYHEITILSPSTGTRLSGGHSLHETSSVLVETVTKTSKVGGAYSSSSSSSTSSTKLTSDASKVVCRGTGLSKALVGQKNNFTVDCSKAGEMMKKHRQALLFIQWKHKSNTRGLYKHYRQKQFWLFGHLWEEGQAVN